GNAGAVARVRSKSPAPPHGRSVHGWTERANRGVVSSWLLLLDSGHSALRPSDRLRCSPPLLRRRGQAKEKSLGRRQAHETALKLANGAGRAPLPQPLSRKRARGNT